MIKITDFNFYRQNYKGVLSSSLFENSIAKASFEIINNINKKLEAEDITEEVQFVVCELVDLISGNDVVSNKILESYSIDGVNKKYMKLDSKEYNKKKREILDKLPIELRRYR